MKHPRPEVSIIIPTKNERKNLSRLLPDVKRIMEKTGKSFEIIIADNSIDGTDRIAERHGCRVLRGLEGKGLALRKAFQKAKGRYVVMMDADLSHRPKELALMIAALDIGYDAAFGSRFILGGGTEDMEWYRKLGNWVFVEAVNLLFGGKFTDLCYGYKAFKKKALERLELKEEGFGIETEMAIESLKKGLRIIEIPSFEKKRWKGRSRLSTFHDGWKILKTIERKLFGR